MFDKLDFIQEKYESLSLKVSDPDVISNQAEWKKFVKELSDIEPIVSKYTAYKKIQEELEETKILLNESSGDPELREMAKSELHDLEEQLCGAQDDLRFLLLPKDPNDHKNVIVEIRAGAGGDEAGLFGSALFRMYMRYAERCHWKTEMLSINETGIGGIKEVSFLIKGNGAYSRLKFESGVHRVQRVPSTESSGRIHTSTVTVAVLPEVDAVEVDINPNDVRVDVYRSSGNGGQSVNTTDSAVRLTHVPTGIIVTCQDEKSQLKNKEKAFKVLMARLYDMKIQAQNSEIAAERRSQVGTGDRSERIRTYNFPQGRVSDHRINMTVYKLDDFLDGDIDEIVDALITATQAEKLQGM